jgi:hypothetical protein
MKKRTFVEPNVVFDMTDLDGQKYENVLGYAESKDELRIRLARNGLTLDRFEEYAFENWLRRAMEETDIAIEEKKKERALKNDGKWDPKICEPYEFKKSIWTVIKRHLFECCAGECAYCESKVLPVAPGDVEHFRPKSKVEGISDHPGYYWLAYDINNLLPCCEGCNRARAKMNSFPLADETRRGFSEVQGTSSEKPLLLNPFTDNPDAHIVFAAPINDVPLGRACGRDERGEESVKRYHLNRPDLLERRREAQAAAITDLCRRTLLELADAMDAYEKPQGEYWAAKRVALGVIRAKARIIFDPPVQDAANGGNGSL